MWRGRGGVALLAVLAHGASVPVGADGLGLLLHSSSVSVYLATMDVCATRGCERPSRWPRPRGRLAFCDGCLDDMAAAHMAQIVHAGNDTRARFRVRHDPCGAIVDVSLPMLRRGWVCQACKLAALTASGWLQGRATWSLRQQTELLAAAGFIALEPLHDVSPGDLPVNVECLECGGAQVDSFFGISEGVRLSSWLPCRFCNDERFKPTATTITERFAALDLELMSPWSGDPGAPLEAVCRRCGTTRHVSYRTLATAPPCLRCDGRRLDPEAPCRVYLFRFDGVGPRGVFKVGITHRADDRRLDVHAAAGGELIQVIHVADRRVARAVEGSVLQTYRTLAPAVITHRDFPHGGWTECWDQEAGHPDLLDHLLAGNGNMT